MITVPLQFLLSVSLWIFKKAGTVQPGEQKAQGYLIEVYKYLEEGMKMSKSELFQWCSVTGQQAMNTSQTPWNLVWTQKDDIFVWG